MAQKSRLEYAQFRLAFIRNLSYILGKIKQKERFKPMKKYCLVSALMNDESLKKLNTILGTKYNIIFYRCFGRAYRILCIWYGMAVCI